MEPADVTVLDDPLKQRLYRLLSSANGGKSAKADGEYAVGSSVGSVRTENQDAGLILRARFGRDAHRDFDLGIVCDGLGGMQRGREAAIIAVVQFISVILEADEGALEHRCRRAVTIANDAIYRRLHGSGGTTLSAVVSQRNREPVFAHAGDSRIYLIRGKANLEQVSQDDTLRGALNKPPDDSDEHGSRLIQFVGMGEAFEPHVFRVSSPSDAVLLTSDGVHGVAQSTLSRAIRAANGASDRIRRLLLLSDVLGGWDNATAVSLPGRLGPKSDATYGSSLSFLTSTEVFEVWHTEHTSLHNQTIANGDAPAAEKIRSSSQATERKIDTPKQKTVRTKKSKAAKKVPSEQLELGAEPIEVSVEFPKPKAQGEPS